MNLHAEKLSEQQNLHTMPNAPYFLNENQAIVTIVGAELKKDKLGV